MCLDNLLNFLCAASLVNNVELPELGKFVNLMYSLVGRQEMLFFFYYFIFYSSFTAIAIFIVLCSGVQSN